MLPLFGYIGLRIRRFFLTIGDLLSFSWRSFRAVIAFPRQGFGASFQVVLRQVEFTGLEAMPFVTLISLIVGSIVIIQSLPQLLGVGAKGLIGIILVITIIRELGPLLTAIIIISWSGTAMSSELGTNRVLGEIETLEAMGIDPFHFIVAPRILGCIISMFCLIIYFDVIALIGGFLVASLKLTMPFKIYLAYIFEALTLTDVYISFSKSLLFGLVIAIFCCYHGLSARRATTEIPQVARTAVIRSMFFVFVASGAISAIFYLT